MQLRRYGPGAATIVASVFNTETLEELPVPTAGTAGYWNRQSSRPSSAGVYLETTQDPDQCGIYENVRRFRDWLIVTRYAEETNEIWAGPIVGRRLSNQGIGQLIAKDPSEFLRYRWSRSRLTDSISVNLALKVFQEADRVDDIRLKFAAFPNSEGIRQTDLVVNEYDQLQTVLISLEDVVRWTVVSDVVYIHGRGPLPDLFPLQLSETNWVGKEVAIVDDLALSNQIRVVGLNGVSVVEPVAAVPPPGQKLIQTQVTYPSSSANALRAHARELLAEEGYDLHRIASENVSLANGAFGINDLIPGRPVLVDISSGCRTIIDQIEELDAVNGRWTDGLEQFVGITTRPATFESFVSQFLLKPQGDGSVSLTVSGVAAVVGKQIIGGTESTSLTASDTGAVSGLSVVNGVESVSLTGSDVGAVNPRAYVEENFQVTTTGNLSTSNLIVDEVGNGWTGGQPTFFVYGSSNEGVECNDTVQKTATVETNGREDVQVECSMKLYRGTADSRWQGVMLRGGDSGGFTGLSAYFNGIATDPDLVLRDGGSGGTLLHTWDLSALMEAPPDDGDTVTLIMRCNGDDITLYSMQVNGGSVEIINDTYTLTGTPATAHGAGSGAYWYGIASNDRVASAAERFLYFKVSGLPVSTLVIQEDFRLTTTGTIADNNLTVDELGNGWQLNTAFAYESDGSGVQGTQTGQQIGLVQTDGREDVLVKQSMVLNYNSANAGFWQGLHVRAFNAAAVNGLSMHFSGTAGDPNLILRNGNFASSVLHTWDLSALMFPAPNDGDSVDLVISCIGNDITLESMAVNGAAPQPIQATYTLTGTEATDHGAGSGADYYGIGTNERLASSTERIEYFETAVIPQSPVVVIEEDFTLTTTGNLTDNNLTTDELGNGWVAGWDVAKFEYESDGSGVQHNDATGARSALVETDGREDVRVECTMVLDNGAASDRWQGIAVRSTSGDVNNGLSLQFDGLSTDPDLRLTDGRHSVGTTLYTWNLSLLMTTPPNSGDTVELIVTCDGDVIRLESIAVNGGDREYIGHRGDAAYVLTGAAAAAHGAGSRADHYGIISNEVQSSTSERFEHFKVSTLPVIS